MQRLGDGSWVISASDLTAFSACPWRVGQIADQKLGKDVSVPESVDPMMELVARLGLEHEQRQLEALKQELSVHKLPIMTIKSVTPLLIPLRFQKE